MSSAASIKKSANEGRKYADCNSKIYFAVGNSVEINWLNLSWVANNFQGKRICFLHVLQPSRLIPSEYAREVENIIHNKFDLMWKYIGVEGEEVFLDDMENVEEGIVKLISQHRIKNLVMGVPTRETESKITEYVCENGAMSCQIWFIHNGHMIKTRYEQVGSSKIEIYGESSRSEKAEKEFFEAPCIAKAAEKKYNEEMRPRKEFEDALIVKKQELEEMNCQLEVVTEERNTAVRQKSLLEMKITYLEKRAEEFEEKIISAVELLKSYKSQRDELRVELDDALRANEDLRHHQAESSSRLPHFLHEITYMDIENSTHHFHPSMKIKEGGNQRVYKGILHGTEVAIKVFYPDGSSEYQQEVEILSKLRHPNIMTLIGACSEANAIIHEYFPNGSLEDRLRCSENSSPLPWQTRISIAVELCSALIFLHSSKPHCIVHGDLKPSNIFLDANFTSKLSEFGNYQVISLNCSPRRIRPMGTYAYLDPEIRTAAKPEVTPQLDVYSFGIILLRLLTGKDPWGIAEDVRNTERMGKLSSSLDGSAGDWPYLQIRHLVYIALRCADASRENRPDLESEVLPLLKKIKASCPSITVTSRPSDDDRRSQAPSYYICPITQDVMKDPQVAADGFTYEAEGIQGWLRSGHNTSPMTNLKLAHTKLVPNRALRSAIQDWLQRG